MLHFRTTQKLTTMAWTISLSRENDTGHKPLSSNMPSVTPINTSRFKFMRFLFSLLRTHPKNIREVERGRNEDDSISRAPLACLEVQFLSIFEGNVIIAKTRPEQLKTEKRRTHWRISARWDTLGSTLGEFERYIDSHNELERGRMINIWKFNALSSHCTFGLVLLTAGKL